MGQSSSINSKTALPANNLLIDASDSYVTDVKLRSTGIIPISEYIKKDKYSKNLSRLKKGKKDAREENRNKFNENEVTKSKLETIKEEKINEKNGRINEKKIIPQNHSQNEVKIEDKKKKKQQFIESSYEDIRDRRKWIKGISQPNNTSAIIPLAKSGKNRKTQTKFIKLPKNVQIESSSEEIEQLYKNEVYPHIYKNKFRRKLSAEYEKQQNNQPKGKIQERVSENEKYSSKTDELRNKSKYPHKKEESTHHLSQLQCNANLQICKKHNDKNLVVQTNVACVIHPNRNLHYRSSSEEIIVKKPQNSFFPSSNFLKKEDSRKERKNDTSSNISNTIVQRKIEKIDKAVEEHRKCLSAKQALENWKNIHTLKQYRKLSQPNYSQYQESYLTNNKNSYIDNSNNDEYLATNLNCQSIYVPPRHKRSRAGNREMDRNESGLHCEMTPLEISNYNYAKLNSNRKTQCLFQKEIEERNHRMKNQNTKDNNNTYERPSTSKYEYIENSTYSRYPQQSRYQDYDNPKYQDNDVNTILRPKNEHYHRSNTAPDVSELADNNMGRTTRKNSERRNFINVITDRSVDRNMERCMERNMERSMDRNMEKVMDREDFIIDMERCLKKRQKMLLNFRCPQSPTSGRTTWVQDKYRRWHKVVIE